MSAKIYVDDGSTDLRVRDELESILDIGRSKDARAGRTLHVVKVERNQRLIFHDEHGTPAQRIDASQDTVPSGANEAEHRSRVK